MHVFNRQFHRAMLGSEQAVCSSILNAKFNRNTAEIVSSLNSESFINENSPCARALQMKQLGSDFDTKQMNIKQQTDLRSLVTALAVNGGQLQLYQLVCVSTVHETVTVENFTIPGRSIASNIYLNISEYYDSKYPGLSVYYCIWACNFSFYLSFFNQE